MSEVFPASISRAIRDAAQVNDEGLSRIKQSYLERYEQIGGPAPGALTYGDAAAVAKIGVWRPEMGTWEEFKQSVSADQQHAEDILNPYIPLWFSKTEDRQNTWVQDCGTMTPAACERVKRVFRECSPKLDKPISELMQISPVNPHDSEESQFMIDVIKSMIQTIPLFLINKGGTNHTGEGAVWRWGPTLCIFAGFGLSGLRMLARALRNDQDWMHWSKCPENELVEDIKEARVTHGYPCGLVRANFRQMYAVLQNESIMRKGTEHPFGPPWMTILLALHVIKHTRFMFDIEGKPGLFVCHDGKRKYIPIEKKDIHAPISNLKSVCADMCQILGVPYNSGKSNREWIHMCSSQVMNTLSPEFFPQMHDVGDRTDLVVPTGVSWRRPYIPRGEGGWANTGIEVCNIAQINKLNGKVQSDAAVGGVAPLMYRWPLDVMERNQYLRWSTSLPDTVRAEPASAVLTRYIRNIVDRGLPEGFRIMIDTLFTADYYREKLLGSAVGSALGSEFPLVFALPEGASLDDTTNQGKSNMVRVLADAIRPGLGSEIGTIERSVSAPAMRNIAGKIATWGTFPVDEFVLPRSADHAFNQAGIQRLATGGKVNLGKAGENEVQGVSLRHFWPICAKLAPDTPDLLNRSAPIFLDTITEENAATEDDLEMIASGKIGTIMRLSHLMWMEETKILHRIRQAKLQHGKWRFHGHRTVAGILAEDGAAKLDAYLEASWNHIQGQIQLGSETGLASDVGAKEKFSFSWYFTHADESTLHYLYNECRIPARKISVLDAVRAIVEDGERRSFPAECRRGYKTEAQVETSAKKDLKKPMVRGPWALRLVKDSSGDYVMLDNAEKDDIQPEPKV